MTDNMGFKKNSETPEEGKMALTTKNYILLLIGFAVIVLGFVLMCGGRSESVLASEFNYEMFSWQRITLAPILVIGGLAFEIYALLKRF